MTESDVWLLTMAEVADTLRIRPGRAYELARSGLLPGVVRIGRQVRVNAGVLRTWIASGGQALPGGWRWEPAHDEHGGLRVP